MRINKYIDERKSEYRSINVSNKQIKSQWEELSGKISRNKDTHKYTRSFLFTSLFLIFTSGIVLAKAQKSQPGEFLFLLKQVTNDIQVAIDGKSQDKPTPSPIKDEIKSEIFIPTPIASLENEDNKELKTKDEASESSKIKKDNNRDNEIEFLEKVEEEINNDKNENDNNEKEIDKKVDESLFERSKRKLWIFQRKEDIKERFRK